MLVSKPANSRSGGHLEGAAQGRFEKVEVTADGNGLTAHAGSGLLVAVADKVGLTGTFTEELAPDPRGARTTTPARSCATSA